MSDLINKSGKNIINVKELIIRESLTLLVNIYAININALVDTGATRSAISFIMSFELESEGYNIPKWVIPRVKLLGITKKPIDVDWKIKLKL